ncbi:transcriptional regulator with XRE-family HTH domain [Alkalibacillus filiformis]|uniref:Transcriptional regulator with XRE-family HTH domain n=1 Tax=Alkalibacillus filiformis TaxID=200990 RepID=A0ABU0DVN3_9BACI|nr:helix-turn-helix transcriptional regulator [Alkalibacillus filiformis]MDQ0352519.1 transcriptional regulator with XRE-family HTH domain [Alkalibacillus filiformis]
MKREWLIHKRKSRKITQEKVAKLAFIDRGYYSQIETGKRNPSPEVAYNIAKALDFDPMKFFQVQQLDHEQQPYTISNRFKNLKNGKAIYLYQEKEIYYYNLLTFIIKGIEKGSYCYVVDYYEEIEIIQDKLLAILPEEDIKRYVHFVDKSYMVRLSLQEAVDHFKELLSQYSEQDLIRIWSPKDVTETFANEEKDLVNIGEGLLGKQILYVSALDSSVISASEHINMMRHFHYIMTDLELVESPLYDPNNKTVLPSLFIQENI